MFEGNFKLLAAALTRMGVEVCAADGQVGGYFLVADVSSTGKTDLEFCRWIAQEKGVAAVPLTVFYSPQPEGWKCHLVRFAICKKRPTILEACEKLTAGLDAGDGGDGGDGGGSAAGACPVRAAGTPAAAGPQQRQMATSPISYDPDPTEERPATAKPNWWG